MMTLKEISADGLIELKQQYIAQATAPLDGMWLNGFVPLSAHYGCYIENKLVGFCCINDDGYLLQFFVNSHFNHLSSDIFRNIVNQENKVSGEINGAFTSTAEPAYLSQCFDTFSSFNVNAIQYEYDNNNFYSGDFQQTISLDTVEKSHLSEVVDFAHNAIGAPKDWLSNYYTDLIERQELFGHWQKGKLIASGECRSNNTFQKEYVDLGVIVSEAERGNGLATQILRTLAERSRSKGFKPICSTEYSNSAAQKSISKAGFSSKNRIIQFNAN